MSSRSRLPGVLGVIAATMGLFFSAFSTHDYALHLDRQLHATNCSFVPGIAGPEGGDNACKAAMYSSYSAIFRDKYWGGIPISLFAMGAYAFFLAMAVYLLTAGNSGSKRSWQTYGLASLTPIVASAVMFTISVTKLGQFCKLCVGLYVASGILAASGVWALLAAGGKRGAGPVGSATDTIPDAGPPVPAGYPLHAYAMPEPPRAPLGPTSLVPTGSWLVPIALFPALGVFAAAPSLVYASSLPDYRPMLLSCGKIVEPNEKTGALVKLKTLRPVQAALTFEDPLCPTCRAFHKRLQTEEIFERLDMTVAIFPLDSECNPMLDRPFHPGSCQLAKAFLCGDKVGKAREVLDWSYENQDELRDAGKAGKEIIRAKIRGKFPEVDACIDDKETKKRLDRILQFAVANKIPISTPQMFLGETRLCEEDTDLGLRYVMGQLAPQVFQPLGGTP